MEDLPFRSKSRHAAPKRKELDAWFTLKIGYGPANRRLRNISVPRSLTIPFHWTTAMK